MPTLLKLASVMHINGYIVCSVVLYYWSYYFKKENPFNLLVIVIVCGDILIATVYIKIKLSVTDSALVYNQYSILLILKSRP